MRDDREPASRAYPGAPRWVKVLGVVTVALAVVFVAVHLAGGGFHHHGHLGGETPSDSPRKSTN